MQEDNLVMQRLMGFALAVKDLEQIGNQLDHRAMIDALIEYATEYEIARHKTIFSKTVN
jgi:hypothetical protein